jgi:hypothetical protein
MKASKVTQTCNTSYTWEAEMGRIVVQGPRKQKISKYCPPILVNKLSVVAVL